MNSKMPPQSLEDLQRQVIAKEKLASLGSLTTAILHEIRTPMNFIQNFSELSLDLKEDLRSVLDECKAHIAADKLVEIEGILNAIDQNIGKIIEHGKKADSLLQNILGFARDKSDEFRSTDLHTLIDEYVLLTYHGVRAKYTRFNLRIHKDYDPVIGNIDIVPQDISRVIINIVNNACYAMQQKSERLGTDYHPEFKIRSKARKAEIEISFTDNGEGIPKEIVEEIYNPFFTTKPVDHGTGLGLSICKDIIVKDHGGTLDVSSEVGEFTTFGIRLPKERSSR